ncbi:unnamed protein product [Adineta ricciae]|uniref:Uncharacterized protein n=2 Tax=Adineta ricciae TaxID=249248 RepID=A0A815D7D5_ADIRI|nr:unnamed protein product [Adineta ricciae]
MSGAVLLLLVPTSFILGTLIVHQSYQSSPNFLPNRWKFNAIPVRVTSPVNVEFFVMSKCPDAKKCETLFSPSLLKLSSIVNFTLSFIAYESPWNQIQCMHGLDECTGNRQQLCVQDMYSQAVFIRYLQCQTREFYAIPRNGAQCANESSRNVINWRDVESCVTSEKSNELFHRSLERTRLASARKSCTIHLNEFHIILFPLGFSVVYNKRGEQPDNLLAYVFTRVFTRILIIAKIPN